MINRYAGEIHINPIRVLRNDDFNNDGQIKDIEVTLKEAIELNQKISTRLQMLKTWLDQKKYPASIKFQFAEGGYISLKGLPDHQLQELAAQGMIELFDFAKEKDWVKKYGAQFGLIWENGRSVEI
jgi:hypothetical protein